MHQIINLIYIINGSYVTALPVFSPIMKVILSNVPPYIEDQILLNALARYGKIRRQVFLILNNPSS